MVMPCDPLHTGERRKGRPTLGPECRLKGVMTTPELGLHQPMSQLSQSQQGPPKPICLQGVLLGSTTACAPNVGGLAPGLREHQRLQGDTNGQTVAGCRTPGFPELPTSPRQGHPQLCKHQGVGGLISPTQDLGQVEELFRKDTKSHRASIILRAPGGGTSGWAG